MRANLILGDYSLVTGYKHKKSISDDVYNSVKFERKDKDESIKEIFEERDYDNINKWGMLQYYQVVDESLTDAEVKERARLLMQLKNRVLRTFSLDALGRLKHGLAHPLGFRLKLKIWQPGL